MNKKVLTLCAAMLLSGSLVSIEAAQKLPTDFKNKIEVVTGSNVITFKKNVDLGADYLLINQSNVIIDGNNCELKGRLVITGENVTVKNLNIVLQNEVNNYSAYKNAITVVASAVTLQNNHITCKVSTAKLLSNGIAIFPTAEKTKFVLEDNTVDAKDTNVQFDNSSTTGLMVALGLTNYNLDGGSLTTPSTSFTKLKDFDITNLDVEFSGCSTNYAYAYYDANQNYEQISKQIEVKPIYGTDGKLLNKQAIADLVNTSNENTEAKFASTVEEFQKIVEDENISTTNDVAIECSDCNYLFNDAKNPDNGNSSLISGIKPAEKEVAGYKLIESPSSSQYGLLIITTESVGEWIVSQKGNQAVVEPVKDAKLTELEHSDAALWRIEEYKTATGEIQYKFFNKLGKQLKAKAAQGQTVDADAKKGIFIPKGNVPYNEFGVVLPNVQTADYLSFGLYKTADKKLTANELTKRYGTYFTLGITYKDDKGKEHDITGKFEGPLRPVTSVVYNAGETKYVDATDEESFMLVNENGDIIVVNTDEPIHAGKAEYGYAFTTLTPHDWSKAVNEGKAGKYQTQFSFTYEYGNDANTVKEITGIQLGYLTVGRQIDGKDATLVAAEKQYLIEDGIIIKLNEGNGIAPEAWLNTPSYYKVEMINKDKNHSNYGKVLGLNEWGDIDWVAPENVDLSKPEGQFAITWNGSDYVFRNRENNQVPAAWILDGALYKVADEKDVYAVVHPLYEGNDTLRITPITADKYTSADGFKRYTASELNANTYTVAMKSLMGDPFIIENHNDKHRLGLSADEYTEWRIEMPTVKLMDATDDLIRLVPDTVTIETPIKYYVAGKGWKETTATDYESDYYAPNTALKICTYILKNTDNGEYLYGVDGSESAGNIYYVCKPQKSNKTQEATRIALKEDADGTVNLVPVYTNDTYYYTNKKDESGYTSGWINLFGFKESTYKEYAKDLKLSTKKIIGGLSTLTGVLKDENLYKATTNDLFVIEKAEAPTYKKLAQDDKIILTLKENLKDEYVLFEDGDFAGMGNRLAHKDINPTLYVDTAYVNRVDNYAYQYLLSVRPTRIDTTYQCNLPEEHGVHRADTTKGFFLVNMVDSALANQNVHNNKFMYDGECKLAFVEGYHTNDSLFFTDKGKVVSKMEVGNGDFNIAKYAFKMVDETENEFVIETAAGYSKKYNYVKDNNGHWHWTVASVESKPGYLRWVNDNLVVTDDIDKAAIFTMEASDKEATANENIAADNVVVAGVNGAVVVKGAEGKNVIVSTILGKVVANEVVSSDNAQITAPAGIVVVSVDGESFKVVVK